MKIGRAKIAFGAGVLLAWAGGWLLLPHLLYERIDQPLSFDHALHVGDDVGLDCDSCHTFDDGRFTGIPAVSACADCHSDALGDSPDEQRLVEDYVQREREIPWLVYARQPDNVHFPHATHVRLADIECARCHARHAESTSLRAFERNRISGYSRDLWGRTSTGRATEDSPGAKMDDCCDCHRERGVDQACLDCHR